ncbi:MAG: sn-glycerol-1-phosphate dehydrogenase [Ruminococcaceae bacterium]|nr:sn-glycerol-1-phosphate dehydrogenase [Oscillospiraceae bacterium]
MINFIYRKEHHMNLNAILENLKDCPCGRKHSFDVKCVEIFSGLTAKAGEILERENFPKKILMVADRNTYRVSNGLEDSLLASGFIIKKLIYDNLRVASSNEIAEITALSHDVDGIISVGTGSLNDICRVASFNCKKKFCIFATAPSMDGFASNSAPIIFGHFKESVYVAPPSIILADTKILAESPIELKASGFGDMVAKINANFEWNVARLISGEHYCEKIAELALESVRRLIAMADRVSEKDEETAGAVMEALVMSGLAMSLENTSRPASGAEHILSHYWECYKLVRDIPQEFHGKKVGVATVIMNKIFRNVIERNLTVTECPENPDWDEILSMFPEETQQDIKRLNFPSIIEDVIPGKLEECWPEIRALADKILLKQDELVKLMHMAGAPTEIEDIGISPELLREGLKYHPYMRHRICFTRILPIIGIDILDYID